MKQITKIMLTVASGAILAGAALSSCKKSNSSLPAIGGYNSSDDIDKTNLLAHWTFENTTNELLSGTAASHSQGITYTTGVNGQGKAAQFTNGYAVFPTIAALSSSSALFANGFTVSAWVKVANNGTTATPIFTLASSIDSQTDWNHGPIEMFSETGQHPIGNDTVVLHIGMSSYINGSWAYEDNLNSGGVPTDTTFQYVIASDSTWINYVAIYNASTSVLQVYANGSLVSNKQYQNRTGPNGLLGAVNILVPTVPVLGSFANATIGFTNCPIQSWQGLFTGTMDNLRIYNTPLAAGDISSLYNLELVGR